MKYWLRDRLKSHRTPLNNQAMFLSRLSALLMEGYTFYDGLMLLLPHHIKQYEEKTLQVEKDFSEGLGVTEILGRLGLPSSKLLPIVIGEINGHLPEALKGLSERLKNSEQRRKKLKGLLLYPLALFLFMAMLLLLFRNFFLPNLQALSLARQTDSSTIFASLPTIVARIPDAATMIGAAIFIITLGGMIAYRKMLPKNKIRFMMSLPFLKTFFMNITTRDFASEIGSLLQSGISMQDALQIIAEQNVDPILSTIGSEIMELVIYGVDFDKAIDLTYGLNKELTTFAKHGANTGHLPKELIIYGEHLTEMIEVELTKKMGLVQPVLFSLIAICILLAYLSLLLPVYGMIDKI